MDCETYLELLSAQLDGALTEEEKRELEAHMAVCPDCRAAGAQLAALRGALGELEEIPAPAGFTRSVMDRIRELESPKVIPLFKRPQFRALAGLAACLVVVVGIYSISRHQNQEKMMLMTRSFQQDVLETVDGAGDVSTCESLSEDEDAPQVNAALVDPEPADTPRIAAYAAPSPTQGDASCGTAGVAPEALRDGIMEQKVAPDVAASMSNTQILTLDRMPEGGWELIPPETPVSPEGIYVTRELLEQIDRLAVEQGITAEITSNTEWAEEFVLVVLEETE